MTTTPRDLTTRAAATTPGAARQTRQPQHPPTLVEKEVRFAVVMYGGVSLAIYINGVAQEFLHMVRSTAVNQEGGSPKPRFPHAELTLTERVYRKASFLLSEEDAPPARGSDAGGALGRARRAAQGDEAIRTKLVVDILSGTSAGGINAVFLAKALANAQDMRRLQQLWIDEGDIIKLLNDKSSVLGEHFPLHAPPTSLLNSQRMYRKLLDAFTQMDDAKARGGAGGAPPAPLADELDLFVTTTDIVGVRLPIRLGDGVVYERRHRNVFHFKYAEGDAYGAERNDFVRDNNPFLAFAARSTSSFPFAFEPMSLGDIDEILKRTTAYEGVARTRGGWQKFFKDYVNPEEFRRRPFADGGALDNKPFTYATDTLQRRSAETPVDRKLVYIEPSPEHPEQESDDLTKPSFLGNVTAALFTLPRYETIREDLQRVLERNRLIRRVNRIFQGIERDARGLAFDEDPRLKTDTGWAQLDLTDMVKIKKRGYLSYHRLEIAHVTDLLANLIALLSSNIDDESDQFIAIRSLIRAWRDLSYVEHKSKDPERARREQTLNQFLFDFNLQYPLRRLNFLRSKIDELYRLDVQSLDTFSLYAPGFYARHLKLYYDAAAGGADKPRPDEVAVDAGVKDVIRDELRDMKYALNQVYLRLRSRSRRLRTRGKPSGQGAGHANPLLDYFDGAYVLKNYGFDLGYVGAVLKWLLGEDVGGKKNGDATGSKDRGADGKEDQKVERVRGWVGELERKYADRENDARSFMPAQTEDVCDRRADRVLRGEDPLKKWIDDMANALRLEVLEARGEADGGCRTLLEISEEGDCPAEPGITGVAAGASPPDGAPDTAAARAAIRACLCQYYLHFDDYDMLTFPVFYNSGVGESDVVEVLRYSPEDATALVDERKSGCAKLAGTAYSHFGAFFSQPWRSNDILWGRLDGAERIIRTLLPGRAADADDLVKEAQAAVVIEAVAALCGCASAGELAHRHLTEGRREEINRLLIEGFLRPRDKQPMEGALRAFVVRLKEGARGASWEPLFDRAVDEESLVRFYHARFKSARRLPASIVLRGGWRGKSILGKMFQNLAARHPRGTLFLAGGTLALPLMLTVSAWWELRGALARAKGAIFRSKRARPPAE